VKVDYQLAVNDKIKKLGVNETAQQICKELLPSNCTYELATIMTAETVLS